MNVAIGAGSAMAGPFDGSMKQEARPKLELRLRLLKACV